MRLGHGRATSHRNCIKSASNTFIFTRQCRGLPIPIVERSVNLYIFTFYNLKPLNSDLNHDGIAATTVLFATVMLKATIRLWH